MQGCAACCYQVCCQESGLNSRSDSVQPLPNVAFALIRVGGQNAFFFRQVAQEREAAHTIGGDAAAIDLRRAANELTEVVPIEIVPILEFPHQTLGVEAVVRLP